MKIGFNLLLWTGHVDEAHLPIIEDLKRSGYDGVEIPVLGGDPEHYRWLGGVLDGIGLDRTVVAIIPSLDVNPIGETASQQKGARDHMAWVLDCAQALGATHVVGPLHSTLGHLTGSARTQQEWQRGLAFHRDVGEMARTRGGIVLAIEALNRFECYFLNVLADLAAYVAAVDHPLVRAMYDTFHANIEEQSLLAPIAGIAPLLAHVHISENDRGTPGRGHIDMRAIVQPYARLAMTDGSP